ncbi:MAG TPA: hypothetical protein DCE41_09625 [Cytophagales bacterium]|nr:hypothetical protein [Cytophagales bacterium]HAA18397.1 hypothetical protein [Cytophagales bacterium]HAP61446.1 hypothetical protein [Cytophagales bacterium]
MSGCQEDLQQEELPPPLESIFYFPTHDASLWSTTIPVAQSTTHCQYVNRSSVTFNQTNLSMYYQCAEAEDASSCRDAGGQASVCVGFPSVLGRFQVEELNDLAKVDSVLLEFDGFSWASSLEVQVGNQAFSIPFDPLAYYSDFILFNKSQFKVLFVPNDNGLSYYQFISESGARFYLHDRFELTKLPIDLRGEIFVQMRTGYFADGQYPSHYGSGEWLNPRLTIYYRE